MRKVYLIAALALIAGTAGLVLWYQRIGPPNDTIAKFIPGATNRTQTITFGVIGDNEGENATYRNLLQQLASNRNVQFILHLGDALENGGASEAATFKALNDQLGVNVPFYMVPGNHDVTDDPNRTAFQNVFGTIPRSVDVANLHLVLLDNADRKLGFASSELTWLENDLQNWFGRKPKNGVTILAYHRPFSYPFASLLGDDETKTSRQSNERFLAILAQYPVDHVYAGHVHSYVDYDMITGRDASGQATATVPVTVSGGGGGDIQQAFGGLLQGKFHALVVRVTGREFSTTVIEPN